MTSVKPISSSYLLFLLSLSFVILSCGKDDDEAINCSTRIALPPFTGITETDGSGVMNGTVDNTDWGFDTSWNAAEKQLFSGFAAYSLNCSNTDGNEVFPAFPNGFDQTFSVLVNKGASTIVRMRLVTADGTVISSVDNGTSSSYLFNLEDVFYDSSEPLRLYYVLVQNDGCAFYGHGDVMENE